MIINYIIFAIRLFRRDKFHSALNIIGLSTGIAYDILIFFGTAIAALIVAFLTASYHCLRVLELTR